MSDKLPIFERAIACCREHPRKVMLGALGVLLASAALAMALLLWVGWEFRGLGDPSSLMR